MNQLRTIDQALRTLFGAQGYRIHPSGEIEVHGRIPGTGRIEWHYYGHSDDDRTHRRLCIDRPPAPARITGKPADCG